MPQEQEKPPKKEILPEIVDRLVGSPEYANLERRLRFPDPLLKVNQWLRDNPPTSIPAVYAQIAVRVNEIAPTRGRIQRDDLEWFAYVRDLRRMALETHQLGLSGEDVIIALKVYIENDP